MSTQVPSLRDPRAWYEADLTSFRAANVSSIIGTLAGKSPRGAESAQIDAWRSEIEILRDSLRSMTGSVFLEFEIPRIGRRADVVLVLGRIIYVIEFKVGAPSFDRAARDQVWDYALDLKNFHEASHALPVIPILVATEARSSESRELVFAPEGVARPLAVAPRDLERALQAPLQVKVAEGALDGSVWSRAPYRPTPTIVEAARALYGAHSVHAIARHDADAKNLSVTTGRIEALINEARTKHRKAICFVTGVPGAGKTLVGLNVATQRRELDESHAVYLSGNGPLVEVLRAALIRDDRERKRQAGTAVKGTKDVNPVKQFIQNVHHFRDEAFKNTESPADRVAIFDEAQRAWNQHKTADFMKRRKGRSGFSDSEPAFLIRYMDRHPDWAVIVCLVGGGQEIHTGEAGIGEWVESASRLFPDWHLHISRNLTDSEYAVGSVLLDLAREGRVTFEDDLHLATSMRSFRADNVSHFVKALLDIDREGARRAFEKLADRYPVVMTRDLETARAWIREHQRGTERCGLLASSKAMRLKPHAIDVRVSVNPVHWFLNPPNDVRSSDYLEDCATEFQVQGLEVDWACVNWDADLRFSGGAWKHHDFYGTRWVSIHNAERQHYLRNAYRVLLTRARQGMVIFVPPGSERDPTRSPGFYDATFEYLGDLGVPEI